MSDPIKQLDDFDPGVPMSPMSAPDVRRRGERLRRRNTALTAVGAALAVAVIATPFAVLDNRDDVRNAPPTGRTGTVQQIPADLDITAGMPENDSGEPVRQSPDADGVAGIEFCQTPSFPEAGATDRVATNAFGPEYGESRELRAYPDVETAAAAFDRVRAGVENCPSEEYSGTTWVLDLQSSTLGEESLLAVRTYENDGQPEAAADWWQVVRVGNALLATATGGEYLPGPVLDAGISQQTASIAAAVKSMCVFSAKGCGQGDPDGTTSDLGNALLTRGEVPERDRLSPWGDVAAGSSAPVLACQPQPLETVGADDLVDRAFVATIAGFEELAASAAVRTAVLQLADQAGAATAYDTVAGWIEDCSTFEDEKRSLAQQVPGVTRLELDDGRAEWRQRDYFDTDICTDCDSYWFDRMGVAQIGDRLVVVSFAEVGGPIEPEGLDQTFTELFTFAIEKSRP